MMTSCGRLGALVIYILFVTNPGNFNKMLENCPEYQLNKTLFEQFVQQGSTLCLERLFTYQKKTYWETSRMEYHFLKKYPRDICLRKINLATSVKDQSFYKNTGEFCKSIATETGLDAKYEGNFVLGASLDITTRSISGRKREVSGTSLNLATKAYEQQLTPNCLYETEMHSRISADLAELETEISSPWHKSSWRHYQRFLDVHGSHVITAITFGASLDQYAFAEQSSSYTARDFTVKACATLTKGAKVSSISLPACSGVTSEEINQISHHRMTSSITLRGGTTATRLKLVHSRTNELILQFMEEGHANSAPIQYSLMPIWQIIGANQTYEVQAINLQYYFDGFLNFGCSYLPGKNGLAFQTFNFAKHSLPTNPVYECTIAPSGCHSDIDCHYTIGIYCSCYGDTCIRHYSRKTSAGNSRFYALSQQESGWSWQGCDWYIWGSSCYCAHKKTARKSIWPVV